ncbi:MAG: DUF2892 domain-containing protein [Phyllobacteriaceae bacterium]|nr:DUF2892 domain-containing protein [Phyllobacteriaceae bacterium]
MFYAKNVPGWERVLRIVLGAMMLVGSIAWFGPTVTGWAVGVMGAMAAMTGLVGFCPACAMVGRRLNH